jgi:polyferredoxin
MSYAKQMLDTYAAPAADPGVVAAAIDAMNDCAQACVADTDANLGDESVAAMVACIRLCLDCADVCTATARVTSRPTGNNPRVTKPLLEACVAV